MKDKHNDPMMGGEILGDEDDDDWYNQMEQHGMSYGDHRDGYGDEEYHYEDTESAADEKHINEDQYFSKVGEENTTISDHSFKGEHDMVWQHLARQFLSDSLDNVGKHATKLAALNPDHDSCSIMILQQWLFSFIPQSLKIYNSLSIHCNCFHNDNKQVYVDNKLHTSFVALCSYSAYSNKLTITAFSPYKLFDVAVKFLLEIVAEQRSRHKECHIQFSGIDIEFYEKVICKLPKFYVNWVEYCGMYSLESHLSRMPPLPSSYIWSDLQFEDSEIINNTWKYKSSESIHMVRNMIQSGNCIGIKALSDKRLVSWCLTYEDGAIGMLYTIPTHRGHGLAGQCVSAVINKRSRDLFPVFCFIESSNESSKRLFQKLGFLKCNDVVWTGISDK